MDGHQCAIFPANGANTPVEIFESDTPLIVAERGWRPTPAVPPDARAGWAAKMVIRVPDDEVRPAVPPSRWPCRPDGPLPAGGAVRRRLGFKAQLCATASRPILSGLTLCEGGDVIEFHSAGGGGYGNPFERDAEAVESDVGTAMSSIERAREDYGVVIDPDSLRVTSRRQCACGRER